MKWMFDPGRIKMARDTRDVTQAQLASMISVSPQQLSQWETGVVTPGQESLMKICNALGCPPKFFFISCDDDNHQNKED